MQIATPPTQCDILYNGKFYPKVMVTVHPQCSYLYQWHIPGAAYDGVGVNVVETEDYEARFDVYNRMSDDGTQFYTVIHVLDDWDVPMQPIDPDMMEKVQKDILTRGMKYFMIDKMGPVEDYTFLGNVLTPTFMYKRVRDAGGDIKTAAENMVKEVFLHGHTLAEAGW